jgi:hypothetical protein
VSGCRRRVCFRCSLSVAFLFGCAVFLVAPTVLSRRTCDVDISSGRLRERVCFLFFPLSDDVCETILSENVTRDAEAVPDWRRVETEPVVAFPRLIPWHRLYVTERYAEVPGQLHMLRLLWGRKGLSSETKRRLADKMRGLWKATGRDDEASKMLISMFDDAAQ